MTLFFFCNRTRRPTHDLEEENMNVNEYVPKGGWLDWNRRQDLKRAAVDAIIASTLWVSAMALLAIAGFLE